MKNKIYLFILLSLCGWNCTDKREVAPEPAKYEVSFAVSAALSPSAKNASLSKQQSVSSDAIYDEVEIVTLYVYNSRGYLVGEYRRWRGMDESAFVTVLEEGDYTVVAVGNAGDWVNDAARLSTARAHKNYRGQVFLDKTGFKVGTAGETNVSLVLKRKVGRLDLDITDQPMNDVYRVRATIQSMPSEFSLEDFLPVGNGPLPFGFFPHAGYDNDFPAYFFVPNNNPSYKTSILLELIGNNGIILKSQWLRDVTIGVNMKTTIRGKLYGASPHHFTVEVEEEWTEEDIIDF